MARAFCSDDPAAVQQAIEQLSPRVTTLVARLLGWNDAVDNETADAVQEVFVAALAARSKFRGASRLETWLTRISVNHCRAVQRKRWLRRRLFDGWKQKQTAPAAESPEQVQIGKERDATVRAAVDRLPTKLREAVVLCYLEEMTPAEAAEVLQIRRGTVEVRLTRARRKLEAILQDHV